MFETLFDFILNEIMGDGEPCDKISDQLTDLYDGSSEEEKKVIDNVFIAISGRTFANLRIEYGQTE